MHQLNVDIYVYIHVKDIFINIQVKIFYQKLCILLHSDTIYYIYIIHFSM